MTVLVVPALDLEHNLVLSLLLDDSDLPGVFPQHLLFPLRNPALDEDVSGLLCKTCRLVLVCKG